eukprot:6363041-Pyramimonas_sp.AAC.1
MGPRSARGVRRNKRGGRVRTSPPGSSAELSTGPQSAKQERQLGRQIQEFGEIRAKVTGSQNRETELAAAIEEWEQAIKQLKVDQLEAVAK